MEKGAKSKRKKQIRRIAQRVASFSKVEREKNNDILKENSVMRERQRKGLPIKVV